MRMTIFNTIYKLLEKTEGFSIIQLALAEQIVEKLASLDMLEHEKQIIGRIIHIVEPQHIGMVQKLHDGDFSLKFLLHRRARLKSILGDDFDRNFEATISVKAELDLACR